MVSQSILNVISFLFNIKSLKASRLYVTANNSASMLLIFSLSLYFPLAYLQIFSLFLLSYLLDFANNVASHPNELPLLSIIR